MQYWLDLFTVETWEEARVQEFRVTGFRERRWPQVSKIRAGDRFVCYLTQVGRFAGILEAVSDPYRDLEKARSIWRLQEFPCLVDTRAVIALDPLRAVPKGEIVPQLSIGKKWGGIVRGSPVRLAERDGNCILDALRRAESVGKTYPLPTRRARRTRVRGGASDPGGAAGMTERGEGATIEGVGRFINFDPYDGKRLPDRPGVYVFYDISDRPIYVGEAQSIAHRIRQHHERFWFKPPIVQTASYVQIADVKLRKQIEAILIKFLKRNAVLNKQHVDRS